MTHVWPSIRPALRSLLTVLALTGPLMERVAAQQLDVNRFVVPTDRDEALFLVNFAEYAGWDLWPSKDAQLDAIQDYARIWMPVVAHYEERAAVAQLHPEVKKILGNLRAFLAANQTYGSSARRFETDSQDRVQEKAGKMGETLTEETLRLLLEKALGTPSSFEAQRRVTARRVFDATSDAVKAKTQVDADLPRWHSQQRLNLQALQQSHFESARLGVAVLKVSHS